MEGIAMVLLLYVNLITKGDVMDKKLTILDVKKKKMELETSILKLINDFEEECGVRATYINFDRKREKETKSCPEPCEPAKGPVENVDVNMELDLIY
jgi:hypothetical protein